mgnify:FL=1
MRDSINKALLFVIALSTSIIAVELVPVSRVNNLKLLCAEFNSIDFNNRKKVVEKTNPELISVQAKMKLLTDIRNKILTDEYVSNEVKNVKDYCANIQ